MSEPLKFADGCVGQHDADNNPICADWIRRRIEPEWKREADK